MSLRLVVLDAGAIGSSVLDLAGNYRHEVVIFTDSSSSMVDPDDLDPSAVHDRREREGVVDGADPEAVFDADCDVLVEATPATFGNIEPGFSYVEQALADDRHVVPAGKGPVAERYADLRALETENGGMVQFEAAVGGAIPTLSTISGLDALHVTAARGVLSGTANSILSWVAAEGFDYEHVLTEAQDLGVTEADPTFDVDGIDTALKFIIPASVLSDGETEYAFDDAAVERIHNVPGTSLDLAAEDGRTVRLIGEATANGVRVAPRLIPRGSALSVMGTQNIAQLETRRAGQLNISGHGVGGPETTTAVLPDVSRLG